MKTWANYNGILYSATMWSEDEVKIRTHDKNEATGFEEKKYPDGHSVYIKIVDKSELEELYDEYEYGTWKGMEFVIDGGTETTHTIWFDFHDYIAQADKIQKCESYGMEKYDRNVYVKSVPKSEITNYRTEKKDLLHK